MKKFTNVLFTFLLISLASSSFAQKIGIKAGLNLSNMVMKDNNETYSDDYKLKPGFHAGLVAEFPISDMISFEPGLLISTKGYKYNEKETYMGETTEMKMSFSPIYLDIPLNLKVAFGSDETKFYGMFGPYLAMGLAGKVKSEVSFMGETENDEDDIKWGTEVEADDMKRLDYGISVGAGVQLGAISVGAGYALGLANVSSYSDDGGTMKHKVISVSVGYKFGGK